MCGIGGRFNYKTGRAADGVQIEAMCERLAHRGPDDRGTFVCGPVALGHRRLSIIDPAQGVQPMQNETGEITAVFNGEIYNYRALRRDLIGRGHEIKTQSDTEVLVHLYEDFGPLLACKLKGMFTLAIHDRTRGRVLLIRDRLGQKPLFYCHTPDGLLFASELKAFLDQPDFSARINERALHEFLCLGYVPGPHTSLAGVYQVPAGGYLDIDRRGLHAGSYWALRVHDEETHDEREAAERVRELFRAAVRRRLIADVPIGLYLSGGIDSIAILAAAEGESKLHRAFTARFADRSYDESSAAARAAREFGVEHEVVEFGPDDVAADFETLVYHADNLLANPAMLPTLALAEAAGRELKVILNGGGGDELFFGYPTYDATSLARWFGKLPNPLLDLAGFAVRGLVPVSFEKLSFSYKARKFLEGLRYEPDKAHFWWRTILTDADLRQLFVARHEPPDGFRAYRDAMEQHDGTPLLARANAADLSVWWRDMGLWLADCVNMTHSVEARLPFMDHELVEFVYGLPVELKYRRGRLKRLFKQATAGLVPQWVQRQKKAGFHVPLASWFAGPLQSFLRDALSTERLERVGLFDAHYVQRLIVEHEARRVDNNYRLWNLAVFVQWHELFVQGGHRAFRTAARVGVPA